MSGQRKSIEDVQSYAYKSLSLAPKLGTHKYYLKNDGHGTNRLPWKLSLEAMGVEVALSDEAASYNGHAGAQHK